MKPLLSIIIPVYNAEKYLETCINSVLHQKYNNIEVLLINDGSTDSSANICEAFARRDSRIKVIHKSNGGQSSARNVGINQCTGDYITFVDADDEVSSDIYVENLDIMQKNPQIDFLQFPCTVKCGTPNAYIRKTGNKLLDNSKEFYLAWLQNKEITSYMWNKIFRRSLFSELRFREGIIYEDRYIMSELLACVNKVYLSESGMYFYYEREGQTTQTPISEKLLQSLICADLQIVKKLQEYHFLQHIMVKRYFDCMAHYKLMMKNHWDLDPLIKNDLLNHKPSISSICRAPITLNMKIQLIKFCL